MTSEIFPNADDDLYSTFYISPDNNVCMHGHCDYYCSTYHGICGNPDTIEISIGLHLPKKEDKTERKVKILKVRYKKKSNFNFLGLA